MGGFKKKILSYIKWGESVTLVGLSGMGKSRFARELTSAKLDGFKIFYLDTNSIGRITFETFKKYLETLLDIPLARLENIGLLTSKYKIALMVDTIDDLVKVADNQNIFSYLKSLRDSARLKLSFIFIANKAYNSEYLKVLGDLFEIVSEHIEFIPLPYDEEFGKEVKRDSKKHGFDIKEDGISKLITLSGKIPAFKKACILAERDHRSTNWKENEKINAQIEEILEGLTKDQKQRLIKCAKGEVPKLISDLINYNLIDEKSKVKSEILRSYLLEYIDDGLTVSEDTLLNLLLEKRGKVVTKDEIIGKVYPDVKIKEGVSDSSISQLVYRLKAKIKNKYEILPLHGRGYKLTNTNIL